MKVRRAVSSDCPALASVATLAFAADPSYEHFFPRRSQYPEDFYNYLLHDYKRMLVTPGQLIMLVELDESDEIDSPETKGQGERGQIVAFGTFVRSGATAEQLAKWNADSAAKSMSRFPVLHCMGNSTNGMLRKPISYRSGTMASLPARSLYLDRQAEPRRLSRRTR